MGCAVGKREVQFKSALGDNAASANQPAYAGDPRLAALRPVARPETAPPAYPTATALTQVVQAVAPAPAAVAVYKLSAADFASAVQPDSPFFPAPLPPPLTVAERQAQAESVSLRDIVDAIKAGKEV